MELSPPSRPRRAERQSVLAARIGRRAVAPIAGDIVGWHDRAARLWAKFDHLNGRGRPTDHLLADIVHLESQVIAKTGAWQASLDCDDGSGRVSDAQKSFQGVLHSLARLRQRICGRDAGSTPRQ